MLLEGKLSRIGDLISSTPQETEEALRRRVSGLTHSQEAEAVKACREIQRLRSSCLKRIDALLDGAKGSSDKDALDESGYTRYVLAAFSFNEHSRLAEKVDAFLRAGRWREGMKEAAKFQVLERDVLRHGMMVLLDPALERAAKALRDWQKPDSVTPHKDSDLSS